MAAAQHVQAGAIPRRQQDGASEFAGVSPPVLPSAAARPAPGGAGAAAGRLRRFFWNAYACVYDALPKYYRPYGVQVERVMEMVGSYGLPTGARILDAGCGTGNYLVRLCEHGYQVLGLDTAAHMLAQARRKIHGLARSASRGAQLRQSSLESALPLADRAFDCIVSINALYMIEHPQSALREFRRVLRPGGLLVLSHPCEIPPLSSIVAEHATRYGVASVVLPGGAFAALGLFNWVRSRNFQTQDFHCWSADEMQARLGKAGFAVKAMEPAYACGSNLLVCALRD